MPDPDSMTDNEHPDDVEAVLQRWCSKTTHPHPRRPPQLTSLSSVHRLDRGAELLPTPRLHLHERHLAATSHDEIDVAMADAEPVGEQLPALAHEPSRCDAFAQESEILPRFRHGPSLAHASDKSLTVWLRALR